MTFHRPSQDDPAEKQQSGWGNMPRIVLVALALFLAAGITMLVCRPDFFAISRAEAAARFTGRAVSSAGAVSQAPSSASASSVPASSAAASSQTAQNRTDSEVPLTDAARPLSVQVSLAQQKVTVADADGRTVETFVCSSGKSGEETPKGVFTVSDRGKSFYNAKLKEGAYYWTRFYGAYLFHSVPFDKNYRMEPEEAEKLGEPASHGCIRLPVDDAKWIYDNIPNGTKVVIA